MEGGGLLTGRPYASKFMGRFLNGAGGTEYVPFGDMLSNQGGRLAYTQVNAKLQNALMARAGKRQPAGTSPVVIHETVPGHFSHKTDLFYAMGAFSLRAEANATIGKNCDAKGTCKGVKVTYAVQYRVDDLYDWKRDPGGCTPSTGEKGCSANLKTVTLPALGVICDECLNRLVIHGWAAEFMVRIRGKLATTTVNGPCGALPAVTLPDATDNRRDDPDKPSKHPSR